ncbi:MAG: CBS domain-containing protein [Ignavibacteriaceae bacterium]
MSVSTTNRDTLSELIASGDRIELTKFIETLSPSETARTISRLSEEEQIRLLGLLSPEDAADMIEDIPDEQAADLVEEIPSEQAAAIMEELTSDHLADVLSEMDDDASQAILGKMHREDAKEARMLMEYAPDCAGGLMISEFLVYYVDQTIQDVLNDLQTNRSKYANYNVQYFYVVDRGKKLAGVLRINDLLLRNFRNFLKSIIFLVYRLWMTDRDL